MTDDDALFVDTNILLTATTPKRPGHDDALQVLNDWPDRGIPLCTSGQILREYLVAATRPEELNGLGLTTSEALENVSAMRARMRFLNENRAVFARLRELLDRVECSGKKIHDAHVVATALSHNVGRLLTFNTQDFDRFAELIELVELGGSTRSTS